MAQFNITGKIHQKPSNNQYTMEFVLIEEVVFKEKSYFNYLPFVLRKNDKSEYNVKLQNVLSGLNIGDEVEITGQPKGEAGKDRYLGKYFLRLEPNVVKVIKRANVTQKDSYVSKEEDINDSVPF